MDQNQVQQEIAVIKDMIEKTRNDTAESGGIYLFIGICIISALLIVEALNGLRLNQWGWPVIIATPVVAFLLSFAVFSKRKSRERVGTYAGRINSIVLVTCSLSLLLVGLLFPLTKVYSLETGAIFVAVMFGVMIFISGAIHGFTLFYVGAAVAWVGAIVMAYAGGIGAVFTTTLIVIALTSFVIPGIVLDTRAKKSRAAHVA